MDKHINTIKDRFILLFTPKSSRFDYKVNPAIRVTVNCISGWVQSPPSHHPLQRQESMFRKGQRSEVYWLTFGFTTQHSLTFSRDQRLQHLM